MFNRKLFSAKNHLKKRMVWVHAEPAFLCESTRNSMISIEYKTVYNFNGLCQATQTIPLKEFHWNSATYELIQVINHLHASTNILTHQNAIYWMLVELVTHFEIVSRFIFHNICCCFILKSFYLLINATI